MSFKKFDENADDFTFSRDEEEKPFTIFLKSVSGVGRSLNYIQSSMTILDVKYMMLEFHGLQPELQTLLYRGKVLQDDKTLQEYNIGKESILMLVSKPPAEEKKEEPILLSKKVKKEIPRSERFICLSEEKEGIISRTLTLILFIAGEIEGRTMKVINPSIKQINAFIHNFINSCSKVINFILTKMDIFGSPVLKFIRRVCVWINDTIWKTLDMLIVKPFKYILRKYDYFLDNYAFPVIDKAIVIIRKFLHTSYRVLIKSPVTFIINTIKSINNTLSKYVSNIYTFVSKCMTKVYNIVSKSIRTTCNTLSTIFDKVNSCIETIFDYTFGKISSICSKVKNVAIDILDFGYDLGKLVIYEPVKYISKLYYNFCVKVLKNLFSGIRTFSNSIANGIEDIFFCGVIPIYKGCIFYVSQVFDGIEYFSFIIIDTIVDCNNLLQKYLFNPIYTSICKVSKFCSTCIKSTLSFVWNTIKSIINSMYNINKEIISYTYSGIKYCFKFVNTNIVIPCINTIRSILSFSNRNITFLVKKIVTISNSLVKFIWKNLKSFGRFINSITFVPLNRLIKSILTNLRVIYNKTVSFIGTSYKYSKTKVYNSTVYLKNIGYSCSKWMYNSTLVPISNGVSSICKYSKNIMVNTCNNVYSAIKYVSKNVIYNPIKYLCTSIIKPCCTHMKSMCYNCIISVKNNVYNFFAWVRHNCIVPIANFSSKVITKCTDIVKSSSKFIYNSSKTVCRYTIFNPCNYVWNTVTLPILRKMNSGLSKGFDYFRKTSNLIVSKLSYGINSIAKILFARVKSAIKYGISILESTKNIVFSIIKKYIISPFMKSIFGTILLWIIHGDTRCIRNNDFGLDIRPATMIKKNNETEYKLKNPSEFGVWLKNFGDSTSLCSLNVNNKEVAKYLVHPGASYLVEPGRPQSGCKIEAKFYLQDELMPKERKVYSTSPISSIPQQKERKNEEEEDYQADIIDEPQNIEEVDNLSFSKRLNKSVSISSGNVDDYNWNYRKPSCISTIVSW